MGFALLPRGARLGRFEIVSVLGQGGMGVVYEALDVGLGRPVALKVLPRELAADDKRRLRFLREAQAAAAVVHPNVVGVHLTGEEGGAAVIALELVRGESLQARLARGPLPWREAALVGAGIARGLVAIHAAGLIHRDLKPGNVLIDAEGRPRLTDFGIAADRGSTEHLTKTGDLLGSFEYMSPEQATNAKGVDARSDLYSLGALLHSLVAGTPPFEGRGLILIERHLSHRPPPLRTLVPETPAALERLVLRLLEKDRDARPASGAEVARDLEAIARPSPKPGDSAASRGWLLVLALAVLVLGAGALFALRGKSSRTAPPSAPVPPAVVPITPRRGFALRETFGRPDWKHADAATRAVFSPDGKLGFSAGRDGKVRAWDLSSGRETLVIAVGEPAPFELALSPDGTKILTGTPDGFVRIFDAHTGGRLSELEAHPGGVRAVAWSKDGARFFTGGGRVGTDNNEREIQVTRWNASTLARELVYTPSNGWPTAIQPLGDSSSVVEVGWGGRLLVLDASPTVPARALAAFSLLNDAVVLADGRTALTVASSNPGSTGLATRWDLETGESRKFSDFPPGCEGTGIDATPDGAHVLVMGRGTLELHAREGDERIWRVVVPWARHGAISPDGKRAITAHDDGTVRLWDTQLRRELGTREGFDGPVVALRSTRTGLVGASFEGASLCIRAARKGAAPVECTLARPVACLSLSPDGSLALVGMNHDPPDDQNERALVDGRTGAVRAQAGDIVGRISCGAIAPNGKVGILGDDQGFVRGFDTERFFSISSQRTSGGVTALAFLDDGARWVSGGRFGAVTVGGTTSLDSNESSPTAPIGYHRDARVEAVATLAHVALSGDDKGTVDLWDLERRELVATLEPPQTKKITALALSPMVKVAAAASADGTVALWSVDRPRRLATIDLAAATDSPTALAFENERTLAVGTARGLVHTFDLSLEVSK